MALKETSMDPALTSDLFDTLDQVASASFNLGLLLGILLGSVFMLMLTRDRRP